MSEVFKQFRKLCTRTFCNRIEVHGVSPLLLICSLLAGSPVGLKSKRFVFEILLARENRGEGTGKKGRKGEPAGNPKVFEYQPTSHPTAFGLNCIKSKGFLVVCATRVPKK